MERKRFAFVPYLGRTGFSGWTGTCRAWESVHTVIAVIAVGGTVVLYSREW
jgi:hypothetical protein